MPTAKLTSKGQITIPIQVRRALKLKTGDRIEIFEEEKGKFVLYPKTGSIMDMEGILQKLGYVHSGPPVTIAEMDQGIMNYLVEKDLTTMSPEGQAAARARMAADRLLDDPPNRPTEQGSGDVDPNSKLVA